MKKNSSEIFFVIIFFANTSHAAEITPQEKFSIEKDLKKYGGAIQPIGEINDAYSKYFTGQSYLSNVSKEKNFPSTT